MHSLPDFMKLGPRLTRPVILLVLVAVASCAQMLPEIGLHDDYMGKSFVQPGKVSGPVTRDATGDPELQRRREIRIPFLPVIPF